MKKYFKYCIKRILNIKEKNNWCLGYFKLNKNFSLKNKHLINKINNASIFKPPSDQFWADPFLFNYKKKKYIFFEKFYKRQNKGVISVCELKQNKLINFKDVLVKPYHLSYPMLFKYKKKLFLIPESYQAKKVEIYQSSNFPYIWKKKCSLFENEITCDPTIFKYKNSLWIFINKTKKNLLDLNRKLFLYKIEDDFKKLTPHHKNPVVTSYDGGRNAGNLIKLKNKTFRPGQKNIKGIYGYGINFYEIKKLNLKEFKEKKVSSISAKNLRKCYGIHHFSKIKRECVFDINLA